MGLEVEGGAICGPPEHEMLLLQALRCGDLTRPFSGREGFAHGCPLLPSPPSSCRKCQGEGSTSYKGGADGGGFVSESRVSYLGFVDRGRPLASTSPARWLPGFALELSQAPSRGRGGVLEEFPEFPRLTEPIPSGGSTGHVLATSLPLSKCHCAVFFRQVWFAKEPAPPFPLHKGPGSFCDFPFLLCLCSSCWPMNTTARLHTGLRVAFQALRTITSTPILIPVCLPLRKAESTISMHSGLWPLLCVWACSSSTVPQGTPGTAALACSQGGHASRTTERRHGGLWLPVLCLCSRTVPPSKSVFFQQEVLEKREATVSSPFLWR